MSPNAVGDMPSPASATIFGFFSGTIFVFPKSEPLVTKACGNGNECDVMRIGQAGHYFIQLDIFISLFGDNQCASFKTLLVHFKWYIGAPDQYFLF